MESNGFPMCIHVSSATQKLLHDVGEWQYFGCREIKGSTLPCLPCTQQHTFPFSLHVQGLARVLCPAVHAVAAARLIPSVGFSSFAASEPDGAVGNEGHPEWWWSARKHVC